MQLNTIKFNLDTNQACAILGGEAVAPLPEGEQIPRLFKGSGVEVAAVAQAIADGELESLGKWCHRAADRFAETYGVPVVELASNGSVVIPLALKALGVGEGDLAYVPASTFQATAGGCYDVKVVPVLAEVLPNNLTIDPAWLRADLERRRRIGAKMPKAIFAVALYAQPPDMPALRAIADEFGLWLILDFAHGPYAEIGNRPITELADIITYSFQESKTLALSEAGAIAANQEWLRPVLRMLVSCGYMPWDLLGVEPPAYGMPPQGIELPEDFVFVQSINHRLAEPLAKLLYYRIPRVVEMQKIAIDTIAQLEEVIREFDFITPFEPVPGVTASCYYKWGFGVDRKFMPIERFRAALWEELNYEVIFPYPALSLGDDRNPLRPEALARWISDEAYLAEVAKPESQPIAVESLQTVALIEWQFLLLPQAADVLRAALTKIARNSDDLTTAA